MCDLLANLQKLCRTNAVFQRFFRFGFGENGAKKRDEKQKIEGGNKDFSQKTLGV